MSDRVWWLGWELPDGLNLDAAGVPDTWPDGVMGWCTGYGDDYQTFVAMVVAPGRLAAWDRVREMYGTLADEIRDRDITSEVHRGGKPISDRFPGANEWLAEVWGGDDE